MAHRVETLGGQASEGQVPFKKRGHQKINRAAMFYTYFPKIFTSQSPNGPDILRPIAKNLKGPHMPSLAIRRSTATLAAFLLSTISFCASAQKSPALDRVSLWVGGYYSRNDTDITARGRNQYQAASGKLKFEDDLGFKRHSTNPRVRADFLIGDSQGFSLDYYEINRSQTKSYSQAIPVLGSEAGARVKAKVDYNFGSATYRWWFGHQADVFGFGVGAAYYKVNLHASGRVYAGDEEASAGTGYDKSQWAPILTIGWRHAFNEQWRLYLDGSGVKKNGGDLNGHIWNGSLGLEWFPWRNVGFALEYSASRLHLNKRYDDVKAKLNLDADGPAFYLRARF